MARSYVLYIIRDKYTRFSALANLNESNNQIIGALLIFYMATGCYTIESVLNNT